MVRSDYDNMEDIALDDRTPPPQENSALLDVRRRSQDSNNGKKKFRRAQKFFLYMVLYICLFLFFWSMITPAIYAAIFGNSSNFHLEKELNILKEEMASQKIIIKRLETELAKKEKQYNELSEMVFIHLELSIIRQIICW